MKRWSFLLMSLLFVSFVSCGKTKSDTIVVATDATWPPMEFVDTNKQIVGFDIDLMKEIAKYGGFKVRFKNTAWDGIFGGLAAGKYDAVISSVTITEERKKTMDFSHPYLNAGQVIIVRSETTGVSAISNLVGKTIGAQIGTTGAFQIDKYADQYQLKKKSYDEIGMAIEDLSLGRIDAVISDTPIAANFALQNEKYRGKLKIVGVPFTSEYFGIAVKKGNKAVLDKINKGLDEVLKRDINMDLKDKWLR